MNCIVLHVQNSCVETLSLKMMVFEAFRKVIKVQWGHKDETLIQ